VRTYGADWYRRQRSSERRRNGDAHLSIVDVRLRSGRIFAKSPKIGAWLSTRNGRMNVRTLTKSASCPALPRSREHAVEKAGPSVSHLVLAGLRDRGEPIAAINICDLKPILTSKFSRKSDKAWIFASDRGVDGHWTS
jgi:hypothetical protein